MNQTNTTAAHGAAEPSLDQIQLLLDRLGAEPGGNLIGLLQEVQDELGYLPGGGLEQISVRTRIPLSRIYGVVSFYAQFYTEPRGRHTVRCCRGTACHVRGGSKVIDAIVANLGIGDGQTTEDMMFTFETVACLGVCALSPVVMVDSTYIGKATTQGIETVLNEIKDHAAISKESK